MFRTVDNMQSSIKCCHAVTAWRAEQGSCEPVSELRARSREREIGSRSFCSQLEAREEYKREIGSQSFCSQLKAHEAHKAFPYSCELTLHFMQLCSLAHSCAACVCNSLQFLCMAAEAFRCWIRQRAKPSCFPNTIKTRAKK